MRGKTARILAFLRPFRSRIIVSIILTGSLTALGMVPPLLIRSLVDEVVGQSQWESLIWIALGLFLIPVLRETVNVFNGIVLNRIGIGIIGKTRKDIFSHLLKLSMQFHEEYSVGSLKERLAVS